MASSHLSLSSRESSGVIVGGFCGVDDCFAGMNFFVGTGSGLEGGVGDRIRCLCTSPRNTEPIGTDIFFGGRADG